MRSLIFALLISAVLCADLVAKPFAAATAGINQIEKKVYIVHLERTPNEVVADLKAKHVDILSSVVGSLEAAKDSILYSYRSINGFSAKLTPDEVKNLSEKPGVLSVVASGATRMHTGIQGGGSLQ